MLAAAIPAVTLSARWIPDAPALEPRYEGVETTVKVTAGKTAYVNDHYMGHAVESNNPTQGLLLPVGEYDIRVEPSTGSPIKQHVKVEADKTVILK